MEKFPKRKGAGFFSFSLLDIFGALARYHGAGHQDPEKLEFTLIKRKPMWVELWGSNYETLGLLEDGGVGEGLQEVGGACLEGSMVNSSRTTTDLPDPSLPFPRICAWLNARPGVPASCPSPATHPSFRGGLCLALWKTALS